MRAPASHDPAAPPATHASRKDGLALAVGALGVVYGDIGTSPLYALEVMFRGRHAAPVQVIGGLSLVIWALTVVVALKYAVFVLQADNDGQGGVFSLYALLDRFRLRGKAVLTWALLLGAGLLFGDGIITPAAPAPPAGLVAQPVVFDGQVEAPRTEWFLAGTAPRRIASPDDKSVIAIDPDMPPAVQRLRFEAAGVLPPGGAWRLDGRRLGPARPLPWAPWPGRHVLELVDGQGAVLDAVSFEVRGAQAKAAGPTARGVASVGRRSASCREPCGKSAR